MNKNGKKVNQPAVLILAAGLSERMGTQKCYLNFSEEETFLDHIISVYRRFVVSEIVLVVNESFNSDPFLNDDSLKVVINQKLDYGRFHSIQLGLQEIENTPVFIQNIDNPFVNAGLLMNLHNELGEAEFAVPVYEGRGGHPILLSTGIITHVVNDFKSDSHFKKVLESFKRMDVIVNDPYIGVNINTREDHKRYFLRL